MFFIFKIHFYMLYGIKTAQKTYIRSELCCDSYNTVIHELIMVNSSHYFHCIFVNVVIKMLSKLRFVSIKRRIPDIMCICMDGFSLSHVVVNPLTAGAEYMRVFIFY